MESPKTIFCDIDGTLLRHHGNMVRNVYGKPEVLPGVMYSLEEWNRNNYHVVLTTGRKESTRKRTEDQLASLGIIYDQLIMGLPNGERVLLNDKKPKGINYTARAVNVVRNAGLANIDILGKGFAAGTRTEKPWGYEELVEYNSNYVVKKLFMKEGHSCSLQYHELKTETIVILKGSLLIYIDDEKKEYIEGEHVTIRPLTPHRMEGLADCLYLEASTNEIWDVVRLQDNYGRT